MALGIVWYQRMLRGRWPFDDIKDKAGEILRERSDTGNDRVPSR